MAKTQRLAEEHLAQSQAILIFQDVVANNEETRLAAFPHFMTLEMEYRAQGRPDAELVVTKIRRALSGHCVRG